jgi:8-oxo-dGTP pyrophosphatase MutT (NUDIX family)
VQNIVKETEEEIGVILDPAKLKVLMYDYVVGSHKYWRTVFLYVLDKPVTLEVDERETIETRWVNKDELQTMYNSNPGDFVKSMGLIMEASSANRSFK